MRTSRLLTVLAGLIVAAPAAGQSLWMVPEGQRSLLLEVFHPDLEGQLTEFPSVAIYATGRFRLSHRFALHTELPAAYVKTVSALEGPSEADVGNPYVGLVIAADTVPIWADVGLRLPLGANNTARVVGAYADLGRFAAWFDDAIPVQALVSYQWSGASGIFLRVRGGPAVWLATRSADETEAVLHTDVLGGWQSARAALSAALTGLTTLTSEASLAQRSIIQGGVVAEVRAGRLRPGLTLFFPIDRDLRDATTLVVGLRLGVVLP